MNILNLFFEIMSDVFDIDYGAWLKQNQRGLCVMLISEASSEVERLGNYNISPEAEEELWVAVKQRERVNALAGYYTPSMDPRSQKRINHDILIISDKWQGESGKQQVATIYHEACHCYRESTRHEDYLEASPCFDQGKIIRKFTRYAYDDLGPHDDQWFTVLAAHACKVRDRYPALFASAQDVVETSLKGDWTEEAMENVEWSKLEAVS